MRAQQRLPSSGPASLCAQFVSKPAACQPCRVPRRPLHKPRPALQQAPRQQRLVATAAAAADQNPVNQGVGLSIPGWLDALYRFTRPHTMLGTTISVVSVSCLAMHNFQWTAAAVTGMLQALVPALLMNISIVGLNQVFDVDIDRVNKPYLPMASGEFSMGTGIAIVIGTALAALALGAATGSAPLMWTLTLSLGLGVLYSMDLPFMRWKRFPWLAAGCILAVRAVFVQLGFYYHMRYALGTAQIALSPPLLFTIAFMLLFSIVIALFKDIPDVKGDAEAGVRTFSVRYGVSSMFWTCTTLLLAAYGVGAVFGLTRCAPLWRQLLVATGHLGLGAALWSKAKQVNLQRKQELVDHYMYIWKLFYAEYLLIPFLQ